MAKTKPTVVVTRKLPDAVETRMRELFDTRLNEHDRPMSQAELVEAVKVADVLVPTVTDRIDSHIISQAGDNFKLIANFGNGVDNIDVATANARNITVTNTPGVLTEDTADMTMALILSVPRRLAEGMAVLKGEEGMDRLVAHLDARQPHLGASGWGSSAWAGSVRRLPDAPRPSACRSHYHNRRRLPDSIEQELEATYWESLDQMLARMDVISIHCPRTPATYHLLSARRLNLIRDDAYLVNTARGEVIDENALTRLLLNGEIAGAGLDVYEHEPAVNPKLIDCERVVLLPHMGSATKEGRADMGEKVIINIKTFMDGHRPPDRVLLSML